MKSPVLLLACAFSAVPFAQCYGNFHANVSVASKVPFVVSAAQKVIASDKTPAATYPLRSDANATTGNIYTLWPDALFFMADMDVDCDGTDFQCQGNQDGQPQSSWGNLSAFNTPYVVVPNSFVIPNGVPQNSLSVVICNNLVYYGILGDTDGDTPEAIGEASWLMAQTCFPDEGLNGATGHETPDVLYIVFRFEVFGVNDTTITNYSTLAQAGNEKMTELINWLNTTNATGSAQSAASPISVTHSTMVFASLMFFVSATIFLM